MNFDYYVLTGIWIVFPIILWKAVPRNRIREAIAAFLFFQMLTWLFSISLTFAGLLEAPVRFFKKATDINFTMEYMVFPTIGTIFQLRFPSQANYIKRVIHYLCYVGIILAFMFLVGTFTNIMTVKMDNLVRSFFNFIIELWLLRRYVLWTIKPQENSRIDTYAN
ncbi:hypothetical protein GCM10008967_37250 [Bacillus carboniphilus]|uniref:Uncharacterized protein n=1 Tax=Bacillus carboniphilus TaxID=86663 RepID=A0ABP3GE59_9BACI